MSGRVLEKVGEEIERIENPEAGRLYWADPRQFEISETNPRGRDDKHPQLREVKKLELSILKDNFHFPIVSDMDFKIVAGGRRLMLATKHNVKVPVLFRRFGSRIEKLISAFVENDPLPLEYSERQYIVKELIKEGLTRTIVGEILGLTKGTMDGLLTPVDIPTRLEEELVEQYGQRAVDLAKEQKKSRRTNRVMKSIVSWSDKPKEKKEKKEEDDELKLMREWSRRTEMAELPLKEKEERRRAIAKNEPYSVKLRKQIMALGRVQRTLGSFNALEKAFSKRCKRRNWDYIETTLKLHEQFALGEIDFSQERMEEGWKVEDLKRV